MNDNTHTRATTAGGGFSFREADDGDGLTISGYVARFDEPTRIEDWDGVYNEQIRRGAFARTISERGPAKVKMQFNHGHDMAFGALPIGVWTDLREDRHGLFGVGRIHDTWHTVPIRHAIESGALSGMSIRFKILGEEVRVGDPKKNELDLRTITEVALFEAGVVVNPAYETTSVALRMKALDLFRGVDAGRPASSATVDVVTAAVPVDGTVLTRTEADPPVGITRREMRIRALTALGICNADQDRNAP